MKKLLVCLTIAAFATSISLQAGEQCTATKPVSAVSACPMQKEASCCAAKEVSAKQVSAVSASKSCCATGKTAKVAKKNVTVKGATLLVRR